MPLYEYRCEVCGARDEVFTRSFAAEVVPPDCPNAGDGEGHRMVRAMSQFQRRLNDRDRIEAAEARWGAEVDAAMGPAPDVDRYARLYDEHAKNLPPE